MSTSNSTFNCNPVLSGSDSKDGGIPLVLAINISFATVRDDVFKLNSLPVSSPPLHHSLFLLFSV